MPLIEPSLDTSETNAVLDECSDAFKHETDCEANDVFPNLPWFGTLNLVVKQGNIHVAYNETFGNSIVKILRSAVGMTHSLRSDL